MPARYESCFHRFADSMTMMVNGIQWSSRFPRLLTKEHMREIYECSPEPQLRVITDISCDIEGSIEFTVKSITYNDPVYTYEPLTEKVIDGYEGNGPVILAVDKFAAGLPLESTKSFGKALLPFIQALAGADFSRPLDELEIPDPFKKAVIVHQGNLTENFRYLNEFVL
jgi:alpha-aminoadipic semialdehyde synthase